MPGHRTIRSMLVAVTVLIAGCSDSSGDSSKGSTTPPATEADAAGTTTGATDSVPAPATDLPEAPDVSALMPLVDTLVAAGSVGTGGITVEDVQRTSPRSDLSAYLDLGNGAVAVGLPYRAGCAWFVSGPNGQVAMGSSDRTDCDPTSVPSDFTLDGGDLPWKDAATQVLDLIAKGNATAVVDAAKAAVYIGGAAPTVDLLRSKLPGLRFGEASKLATDIGVGIAGTDVSVAVLGQSGTCYLVAAHFGDASDIRYGTSTTCDAATAATAADTAWPD